ncbi:hypothetical protein N5C69_19050 [Pseudomonas aeruginosa]|uniref:hypothetical protein n=1 Tax=Pseudomonas aeruginosa TaxID=287 RepID=UPI00244804FA|nr:hypothetical protein [Pseudomonas aeruginosa]MDH0765048.1 hypothetical protein [Pseudomonas aeruginosa]MDH1040679.1 hypothetical protein [Pseudomonas aeruginosa]MDH1287624.1 hypothetical protein [Pseudomonas aeruginosa]HBP6240505.1 hypothetical protein [Pseudomonas aeruginosa]HCI2708064.1 hypothetical protein [Pseudomonas aeruginosa]
MDAITSYLQPGRLADVLALIQVLAYDRDSYRSEDGLNSELQRKPSACGSWMAVAKQHPEFFRVRDEQDREPRVALLARYVLDQQQLPGGEEKRPPLDVSVANKLMELAIQLHDKQLERKNRWKMTIIPMAIAVLSAGASVAAAIISSSNESPAPTVLKLVAPTDHSTTVLLDTRGTDQ